ncbi:MAG TPA: polysaccharide deacetylase family protein [Xanthobacteraceae bacterium]|nr:polysaccharide deacetylase family protein [Xanthobacteraceae bacterium]
MIDHRLFRATLSVLFAAMMVVAAQAAPCPGNPDALGTARDLPVDAARTPRVGHKQFPQTLPLSPGEVVLTFDDGPWPNTTERVLDALRAECVRATFFLIGKNALARPALAERELAEGHSIGYHSFSHPMLDHMPIGAAESDIDRGITAVDTALHAPMGQAAAPFFRFPYFASTAPLLDWLAGRHMVVFGADLWASDWNRMTPDQELELILSRVEATRGGIVLFHDTKAQTAAMLPAFLRALKTRGFSIVHVVAAGGEPPTQ